MRRGDTSNLRIQLKRKTKALLSTLDLKKLLLMNIPYIFVFLFADRASCLYRLSPGADIGEKLLYAMAHAEQILGFLPSFYFTDLLVGVGSSMVLKILVWQKQADAKKLRKGVEYGSARWGTKEDIKPFMADDFWMNIPLTATESITMESRPKNPKYARNKNICVIGGSGSGKTRFFVKVSIMMMNCSMVITDPKGTLIEECGKMLAKGPPLKDKQGRIVRDKTGKVVHEPYVIKVLNTINFSKSLHYNPFAYLKSEKDILKLVTVIIANTKGEGEKSTEDFWVKAEKLLYTALIALIWYEGTEEEKNMNTLIDLLNESETREDDENYKNPVDMLFDELEKKNPEHFAVRQYKKYKLAAGKTAKSILISVGVRLAAFYLKEIANLTCTDELDLASIGEKKVALFCCIPDADTSLNYLVGMIYSNLFQTLYYVADRKYGGRLPIPVHCIMDEWPNVALPDDFDKILATMRSRAISCSIIIQNMAQMKALFKDSWESLVGNCDELLYLGGNEKEGHKYISELLGKETLDTNTYGQTKGRNGSYSTNYQQTGRELFTPDEIRLLDNRKAILFVRGERPMLDDKYNLKKHPNVKWTEDGGAPPYDYAKAPRSHDDLNIDIERLDDYELLCEEDILGKEQPF